MSGYRGHSAVQLRLKELGLVRGTRVLVKRFAPLGDPMELVVRGYALSIRKKDAAQILVIRDL
ncbi:MAG: FeoA family protein [Candidatus Omnitrophota bacterium]